MEFPPDIRKTVSYVALFREPEPGEREKLFKNFGGLAGSFDNFNKLMDELTGDYTCMIIKKRAQTNKLEDCIFYCKADRHGKWKFGCEEYLKWAKDRYNKDYAPQL
jgi:hypothetical protein